MSKHITAEDVAKVAGLARLELTENEKGHTVSELESILTYIDRLSTVDTEYIEPYAGASVPLPLLRKDTAIPFAERDTLMTQDRFKEGLLVTKRVFSKESESTHEKS